MEPKGIYMEVNMYLTFNALGSGYEGENNLEIVLDFNLPSGAIVHDSWLWLPDDTTIVKADVYDIRAAYLAYETIVERAHDPSMLFRKENGGYQLRIFPLEGEGSRKVRISYLSPTIWSGNSVETWLPLQILNSSNDPLPSVRILTLPDTLWEGPLLKSSENITFESYTDPNFGEVLSAEIPNELFEMPFKFSVDSPISEAGIFAGKLIDGADQFYQIAYFPPELEQAEESKNVVVLFDHNPDNAHVNKMGLFETAKEALRENLNDQDSFNVIFSKPSGNQLLSNDWISGDEASINAAFSQVADPINDFSNLISLLHDGISFIKEHGGEGDIVLIANTNNLGYNQWSTLTEEILNQIGQDAIRINIVNYQTLNTYSNWWWSGQYTVEYNHRRLYEQLTYETTGAFYSVTSGTFNVWEGMALAFSEISPEDYYFDFNVSLGNGLTYNRFNQHYYGQSVNPGKPILQVGKFIGQFPMTVNFIGGSGGEFIADTRSLNEDQILTMDTLSREIWTGHYLKQLEGLAVGNNDDIEIINLSKKERVLSKLTAFLALDIENGGEPCLDCWGEIWLTVDTEESETADEFKILAQANPNPCSDGCRINFEWSGDYNGEVIDAEIFDAFGKLITTIDTKTLADLGKMEWFWDASDKNGRRLPDGIYFLTIKSQAGVQTLKLMLLK